MTHLTLFYRTDYKTLLQF